MKKCIALAAIPGSQEAWLPCIRPAQGEHALCRQHSDLVAGVMLGICVSGIGDYAAKKVKRKAKRPRSKRTTRTSEYGSRASRASSAPVAK